MTIFELVVILTIFRGESVRTGLNKQQLLSLLNGVTQEEIQMLNNFNTLLVSDIVTNIINLYFKDYNHSDMIKYLQYKYIISFPIPLTYCYNKKETIVAFYVLRGVNIELKIPDFTSEQQTVINRTSGFTIVNAGPGTGKTTTACQRAFSLLNDGVIFLSYTNAAVNEDKKRMYIYPNMSNNICSTDLNKKLAFKTVDSIAGIINCGIEESYDHSIRSAIELLKTGRVTFNQKHIIVDEAQDIDDLRSEFIETLYKYCRFQSITVFGDPRQRINDKNGNWYRSLWVNSDHFKIGFTISHRFHSQKMCDLVNDLSSRRHEIHCELTIPSNTVFQPPILIYNDTSFEVVNEIAKNILSSGLPFKEFMIVGPSIDGDNKTSKVCRNIASIFKRAKVPCKFLSEGSYEKNGVLFTTIQSVKGKEADYVFIFGIDNYPNTFNMIPYDIAESLIYIAHSRARKGIFYILTKEHQIKLPRGIEQKHIQLMTTNTIAETDEQEEPKRKNISVTELTKSHDFNNLLITNQCNIISEVRLLKLPDMPIRPEQTDFFGILIGLTIEILGSNKLPVNITRFFKRDYSVVDNKTYDKLKFETIDGYYEDGIIIRQSLIELLFLIPINTEISEFNYIDFYNITILYIMLTSGEEYNYIGNYDESIIDYCKSVVIVFKTLFNEFEEVEYNFKFKNLIGVVDIITTRYVIELKTTNEIDDKHKLQTMLYSALTGKLGILINLKKKEMLYIRSNRNIDYWRYLISKFFDIKYSIDCITFRTSEITNLYQFEHNTFIVDTEFTPNGIFEITLFNVKFPFKSIVQIVYTNDYDYEFVDSWLNRSDNLVTEGLFKFAPRIEEILQMFNSLISLFIIKPKLYYYIAKEDVSWVVNVTKIDFALELERICLKSGVFTSSFHKPKLIDYYNNHITKLDETLVHHHALTDTIMLYEIILLYNHEMSICGLV